MTMTIEKIEFPRRETKQSKSKKALTIDSDDEPEASVKEIDPVIAPLEIEKTLEPEQLQEPDKSSASSELSATENSNIPNDQLKTTDEKPTAAPIVIDETIAAIQTAFENHLIEDGKGSATIASYTGDIQGFIQWLKEKKLPFVIGTQGDGSIVHFCWLKNTEESVWKRFRWWLRFPAFVCFQSVAPVSAQPR